MGRLLFWFLPRRRRLFLSNLHHAFPNRTRAWRHAVAAESSRRLFETGFLSLAGPFLTEAKIRQVIFGSAELNAIFAEHHEKPFPLIIVSPHLAYWEALTWFGLTLSTPLPEMGIIYRPLNSEVADAWVKSNRERFGMTLLSRRTGLQEAFKLLRRNAVAALLFDQNAGNQGALSTLFGRVCSTSDLPGLLAERHQARVAVLFARRLGFWKIKFECITLPTDGTAPGITLGLNRWLENTLTSDNDLCSSWLWSHDRWRNQDVPERRLRLEAKRNLLEEEKVFRGWTELPRKTRIWIRMPNWLGDVVMAFPLLRALRKSRPDAEITLIAKEAFLPLLRATQLADELRAIPSQDFGYFGKFWSWRYDYPDTYLLFTHSIRADIEAWLTRAPQRFGLAWPGSHRPLLTHLYRVPETTPLEGEHQANVWENFFRYFGVDGKIDRSPLRLGTEQPPAPNSPPSALKEIRIGIIAGSENNPEKRWPVHHWRTLISTLSAGVPEAVFILFGTKNDFPITSEIARETSANIRNLAGQTDLVSFAAALQSCTLLVTNDTGGMHLANALGVPLVALFGPTNPVRTGPIFDAPFEILRAPSKSEGSGANLQDLDPADVLQVVRRFLPYRVA